MRKNLLILGSMTFMLSLQAQVLTYVGTDALVTVQDGALVYSGGGWKNATKGVVNNTGDIMVVGNGTNDVFDVYTAASLANDPNNADFRLKFVDGTTYGQLYISGIAQGLISGKVNKEYKADTNHSDQLATLGRQQTSLPFYGYTIGDLKRDLGSFINVTDTGLYYAGRFNVASVFKWNNGRARYDQIAGGDNTVVGSPWEYYILPRRSQSADGTTSTLQWDAALTQKTFTGVPASDEDANARVSITGAAIAGTTPLDFGINGNGKNAFYERYNSYLIDPFRTGGGWTGTPAWEADYGRNLYEFANPFLTNIDLKNIGHNEGANGDGIALTGLYGVATFGANSLNWDRIGSSYTVTNIKTSTTSGGILQGGDVDVLVIKPMGEFYLKMNASVTSPATSFSMQNTRRFAQTVRTGANYGGPTGKLSGIPADKVVKQVAAVLRDSSGNELGRTYYAVSQSAETGFASQRELQAYVINYPIYTKEEIPSGGEDINQDGKLYINAANEINFAGKQIPLKIENTQAASISFEVYEGGARLENGAQLSTGKSFFITRDNVVTKIADGQSIPYEAGTYGLYYDTPQGFLGTSSTGSMYQTVIAKKESDWVIRFAKDWKNADIEVYSAAGQLIHSRKNVSTSQDYIIPLYSKANGLYIVKTTSDSGEVVTKKIVK